MAIKKKPFLEFWRTTRENEELLQRAGNLRLLPSQLMQLHGDSGIRADVEKTRWASVLPPVGTEVFRRLTNASLEEVQHKFKAEKRQQKRKEEKKVKQDGPKPADDLEAGKTLPFYFGKPAPGLVSTPLEELDPFYHSKKTFVVLNKGNIIHRFNAGSACSFLSPINPLRTVALSVLIHSLFRLFLLVAVLTNCMFTTISDIPEWIHTVEFVFISVYILEAAIKILSRGFCLGTFTYLRDPWNWLDLLIIITACVTEFANLGHLSGLRMFRVIRILKIIPLIPGMKTTVGGLVHSVKRLGYTLLVTMFVLCIIAMLNLQFFLGDLTNKCVSLHGLEESNVTDAPIFNYTDFINNADNQYYFPGQLDALVCGNSSYSGRCPEGFVCLRTGGNPNYGYTSYDSFGWALLSAIRMMTLDFWENLAQLTLRASGQEYILFFIFVLFFGSFCLRSLFWAVIAMAMVEHHEAAVAEAKRREDEFAEVLQVLNAREEGKRQDSTSPKNPAADIESQEKEQTSSEELQEGRKKCHPCGICPKCDCCACWRGFKQRLRTFVMHPLFDLGIVICLILYTIFLAMLHYPMTEEFFDVFLLSSLIFTSIFCVETGLKILAMGPYDYFQVNWNIFEFFLVVLSLLDLALADVYGLTFDFLRVLRLARWWPVFNMLLQLMAKALGSLRNLTLVLAIIVFLFSVVGMHLIGQHYNNNVCKISMDCELPRWHMVSFFHAFTVVYRALCGEWIEIMWDCMEVAGQPMCMIFFLLLVTIGNLVLASLSLALLVSSFSCVLEAQKKEHQDKLQTTIKRMKSAMIWCRRRPGPAFRAISIEEDEETEKVALSSSCKDTKLDMCESEEKQRHLQSRNAKKDQKDTPEDCCCQSCYRCCPFLNIDTSSGSGRAWSNFRKTCLAIVEHMGFEVFITVVVLFSSAFLVFEDIYVVHRLVLKTVLHYADVVFVFVFVVEMLLMWCAHGFKKYFTNGWCCLDFLVVIVCLVHVPLSFLGYAPLECIKCLRSLRNLSRFQRVKRVVSVLCHLLPKLFEVLLACLTLWLVFNLIGMELFAGKFNYCYNETSDEFFNHDVVGNKTSCLALIHANFTEIRWKQGVIHFNNALMGYVALLEMATFKGWMDLIYFATDSTWVESQPRYEANVYLKIYFVVFTIVSFFTFIFIIRSVVNHLTHQFGGRRVFLTDVQKISYWTKKKKLFQSPQKPAPRPENNCQAKVYDLVTRPCFEISMMVVICINMVVYMLETRTMSHEMEKAIYCLQFILVIIFLLECILKIIAFRKHYFTNCMNVMDFVIILLSVIGLFIHDFLMLYLTPLCYLSVLRLLRFYRVLQLIPKAKGIWKLVAALILSLPSVLNISLLLFFLIFTYSLVGMTSFAFLKRSYMIDDMTNFETFWSSMTLMLQICTTAGWDGVLLSVMSVPPDCDPSMEHLGSPLQGDCGSPGFGLAFCISFVIISLLLVLLMFIAVVLDVYAVFSEDSEQLCDNDVQMFYNTWKQFDPDASQYIEFSELSDFCDALKDPLRIPKPNKIKLIHMDVPLLPGDKVHYLDILMALHAQVFGASGDKETLKARLEGRFKPSKVLGEPISSTLRRKQEEVAAQVIQKAFRNKRTASDSERHTDK